MFLVYLHQKRRLKIISPKIKHTSEKDGKALIQQSFFVNLLLSFANFLSRIIGNSSIISFFTAFDKTKASSQSSFFASVFQKLAFFKNFTHHAKQKIAYLFENSIIISSLKQLQLSLLSISLRVLGEGILCFGLFSTIVQLIKWGIMPDYELFNIDAFTGFALLIISLPMIPIKSSIASCLSESRISSFILFKLFAFKPITLKEIPFQKGGYAISILIGMILGTASYFVSPLIILSLLIGLVALCILFAMPETGVIFLFLTLPFLPTMVIAGFIIITFIAYFFKLIRGKRVFRLDILDYMVFLFAFILLLGGLFSFGGKSSLPPALLYVVFSFSYFLVKNLIRSIDLTKKCVGMIVISSFIVSIYGIYQNFFGANDSTWIDSDMFSSIQSRVVSTFENPNVLGEYLILFLPILFMLIVISKGASAKLSSFVVFSTSALCLVYTWSRGAWLGFIISFALLLLLYHQKTMIVLSLALVSVPFLPFVLPETIITRFTSIGNLSDSSTSFRLSIWEASIKLIKDFFVGGIGIGESAFSKVYPGYSYAGIESAPHSHNLFMQIAAEVGVFSLVFYVILLVIFFQKGFTFVADKQGTDKQMNLICLGGLCGILAFHIQGFTDYVWYNYRVFLMFWLVFGLCISAIESSKREYIPIQTHLSLRQENSLYDNK